VLFGDGSGSGTCFVMLKRGKLRESEGAVGNENYLRRGRNGGLRGKSMSRGIVMLGKGVLKVFFGKGQVGGTFFCCLILGRGAGRRPYGLQNSRADPVRLMFHCDYP